jgi:hypothetical protein
LSNKIESLGSPGTSTTTRMVKESLEFTIKYDAPFYIVCGKKYSNYNYFLGIEKYLSLDEENFKYFCAKLGKRNFLLLYHFNETWHNYYQINLSLMVKDGDFVVCPNRMNECLSVIKRTNTETFIYSDAHLKGGVKNQDITRFMQEYVYISFVFHNNIKKEILQIFNCPVCGTVKENIEYGFGVLCCENCGALYR